MEHEVRPHRTFVRAGLPWVVAAGALAIYCLTLNHWVSFSSLLQTAKVSGATWQPEFYSPLNWLVTYPFRWLPARMIPLALNMFSAVCAAGALAMLARSVALLPHDRTHDQRQKEQSEFSILSIGAAWVPPVLAAIVCGLQFTFWEHATSVASLAPPWGSGCEMFDLFLFAYVVRCLLEFRIDQRVSWLYRCAFVYGAAITNNWAFIGFFPLLLVALVWLRGLEFFNLRFLSRVFVCGLAGLSFYLLLPLAQGHGLIPVPFWPALKANLAGQKYVLGY